VLSFGASLFAMFYNEAESMEECHMTVGEAQKWTQNFAEFSSAPAADSEQPLNQGLLTETLDWMQADWISQVHDNSQGFFYLLPLLGTSINADSTKFSCMLVSKHPLVGPVLMLLFLISTLVLLTNMLIAMMNHTFTSMHQKSERLYRFRVAHRTILAKSHPKWNAPPPLNILFLITTTWTGIKELAGLDNDVFGDRLSSLIRCEDMNKHKEDKKKKEKAAKKAAEDKIREQLARAKEWWEEEQTRETSDKAAEFEAAVDKATKELGDESKDLCATLQTVCTLVTKELAKKNEHGSSSKPTEPTAGGLASGPSAAADAVPPVSLPPASAPEKTTKTTIFGGSSMGQPKSPEGPNEGSFSA